MARIKADVEAVGDAVDMVKRNFLMGLKQQKLLYSCN
jgi:hypothetical protein